MFFQGPALMTSDTHVWRHPDMWTMGIIYIWDHTTIHPSGVNSTAIFGYMAYTFVYMGICKYGDDCTHIYILTDGFMIEDAGPLFLVKEELCIKLIYITY